MAKETLPQSKSGVSEQGLESDERRGIGNSESCSSRGSERASGVETCRVCQCLESDETGDTALEFLGISTPPQLAHNKTNGEIKLDDDGVAAAKEDTENDCSTTKKKVREPRFTELISPEGEVLIFEDDLEMGLHDQQGTLIELGCSCKNDLALVHYACALKWFVNHGSTVCEICGNVAKNIRTSDFRKVICGLKEYEALRERTASGEPNPVQAHASTGVDPNAVAAIRRQRLSEISLWFGLPNNSNNNNNSNVAASQAMSEQSLNVVAEEVAASENPATKWAVESSGILLATGLLTVNLAWLIEPRVGKKTARSGLHIFLGGICAIAVVVFFRIFVLTRIKNGPARYWAIWFLFGFLVFGIWASRTHVAHST